MSETTELKGEAATIDLRGQCANCGWVHGITTSERDPKRTNRVWNLAVKNIKIEAFGHLARNEHVVEISGARGEDTRTLVARVGFGVA